MKLAAIRISSFQCFGPKPTEITFENVTTMVIGPNGSGKTAILQALSRMFDANPGSRRIRAEDFHIGAAEETESEERQLSIEADFLLPEASNDKKDSNTIPPCFIHMRLNDSGEVLKVRYRLEAIMGNDGDIEDTLYYVVGKESNGDDKLRRVGRAERNHIAVYYLPARRNPNDHIRSNTSSVLGRIIKAINWSDASEEHGKAMESLRNLFTANPAIQATDKCVSEKWSALHKGSHFKNASVTFGADSLEQRVQNFSVQFTPAHAAKNVNYDLLSDGHKSLLYLSLVTAYIEMGRKAMSQNEGDGLGIMLDKLNPPVFSIIAIEEPENSLSPHYLGRINKLLAATASGDDAQAIVTTHAPSMLKRIEPEQIRFCRVGQDRTASIKRVELPTDDEMDAHKFVREGLLSNPEIYFARMVVLGEGASEDIVLPRLFEARGLPLDENGIVLAQLGGRHVNYLWKILTDLNIPYATLLDLDLARFNGGWGRITYAIEQLKKVGVNTPNKRLHKWSDSSPCQTETDDEPTLGAKVLRYLKRKGVFFSQPMDLDFSMIFCFPSAYGIGPDQEMQPDQSTFQSVLGKSHGDTTWYSNDEKKLFDVYHRLFKVGSKPAAHIEAFSKLDNVEVEDNLGDTYRDLISYVASTLDEVLE